MNDSDFEIWISIYKETFQSLYLDLNTEEERYSFILFQFNQNRSDLNKILQLKKLNLKDYEIQSSILKIILQIVWKKYIPDSLKIFYKNLSNNSYKNFISELRKKEKKRKLDKKSRLINKSQKRNQKTYTEKLVYTDYGNDFKDYCYNC